MNIYIITPSLTQILREREWLARFHVSVVSEQLACTELSEEEEELERVEGVFFLAILLAFKLIRMESQ